MTKDTPDSDNDTTCLQLKADEGFRMSTQQQQQQAASGQPNSRPSSLCSESLLLVDNAAQCKKWVDSVSVPLMMAYITRYIFVSVALLPRSEAKQNQQLPHLCLSPLKTYPVHGQAATKGV